MRKMILLAVVALAAASCTRGLDEAAFRGGDEIRFVVGDFPAFGGSETRAVGTEDPGKTEWAAGDELLLVMTSNTLGTKYATFTYNGSEWKLTDGELAYKEDEVPTFPHVYYAPNYKWEAGKLVLKEGKVAGTDEYIEGKAYITPNGEGINVSFADATRNYSRLRIATMPNKPITVAINKYIPAGSSEMEWFQDIALTSDEKGNAYLYGTFGQYFCFDVKYEGTILATHTFYQAAENAKSYVLDATVVSLADEAITYEQIVEVVKKELDAGRTYINLILAPDADENVFVAIHAGLMEAGSRSINLTLIGCKKIPSSAFSYWTMLKSIALPDVIEIGESAFNRCIWLQKVVFGSPLTIVYGNPESSGEGGIFEGLHTEYDTYLVLSGEQNLMSCGQHGRKDVWTPGEQAYKNCSDHQNRKFLGYTFKSVTCGDRMY